MTISLFSIVVVGHALPLLICALLRRYDDTFYTNVCVKNRYIFVHIYAIYYAYMGGEAKLSSYRRKKKYKSQAGGFSGNDDFKDKD